MATCKQCKHLRLLCMLLCCYYEAITVRWVTSVYETDIGAMYIYGHIW